MKHIFALVAVLMILAASVFTGCNVTRSITTESKYFTKGDTTCTIVTKTIETYDAKKNGSAL